jgi:hypothetical protein
MHSYVYSIYKTKTPIIKHIYTLYKFLYILCRPLELNVEINMKCQVFQNLKLVNLLSTFYLFLFSLSPSSSKTH